MRLLYLLALLTKVVCDTYVYYDSSVSTYETVLQQAIDSTTEGAVYLSSGTFILDKSINMKDGVNLYGDSNSLTVIQLKDNSSSWKPSTKASVFTYNGMLRFYGVENSTVAHIVFDGNKENQDSSLLDGKNGVLLYNASTVSLYNCTFRNFPIYGVYIYESSDVEVTASNISANTFDGALVTSSTNVSIQNNTITKNQRHGVNVRPVSSSVIIKNNTIAYSGINIACGVKVVNSSGNISSNIILSSNYSGLCISNASSVYIYKNYIANSQYPIDISESDGIESSSNIFFTNKDIDIRNSTIIQTEDTYFSAFF